MLVLIITSLVSIFIAWFSFFLGVWNTNKRYNKEKREYFIMNFYNPICSLLSENNLLYLKFGPKTFNNYNLNKRAEAGELWESIKKEAIIPNLISIRKILIQHQNFYMNTLIKNIYTDLQLHCLAFELYNNSPNEVYNEYKFNQEWINIIEQNRKEYIIRIAHEFKCFLASSTIKW